MLGLYKTCADYINSVGKRENSASVVINTLRKKKVTKLQTILPLLLILAREQT